MKCRVRLERIEVHSGTAVTSHPAHSNYSAASTSLATTGCVPSNDNDLAYPHRPAITNTKKESKAKPLSKRVAPVQTKASQIAPLAKIKSARTLELEAKSRQQQPHQQRQLSALDLLMSCRHCRVKLVDCWKGLPIPSYILHSETEQSFPQSEEELINSKRLKKKKKKEKHKHDKVCYCSRDDRLADC